MIHNNVIHLRQRAVNEKMTLGTHNLPQVTYNTRTDVKSDTDQLSRMKSKLLVLL